MGGGVDFAARLVALKLGAKLGQWPGDVHDDANRPGRIMVLAFAAAGIST